MQTAKAGGSTVACRLTSMHEFKMSFNEALNSLVDILFVDHPMKEKFVGQVLNLFTQVSFNLILQYMWNQNFEKL